MFLLLLKLFFLTIRIWQVGIGGGCSIYTPPESFWCSEGPYGVPSGVFYPANTFSHKWADPMVRGIGMGRGESV